MGQEESSLVDDSVPPHSLSTRSLSAVAEYIHSSPEKRIVVLTGAGISTAAGIPDFRSPKTGLYHNLARLRLPHAEAVFDIEYFRRNPEPFYFLARELYPGNYHPTVSHAFISLLARKGLLHMLFTQNIDCLERAAGVPPSKIVEAHGSFASQRCIDCKAEFPEDAMKEHVLAGRVPRCPKVGCGGIVKPDIVFFGESLPPDFSQNSHRVTSADLVLIIGTSLSVYPFAGLPELVASHKPRLLFNLERVGQLGKRADDVLELGPCDVGIRKLADALGWREELEQFWRELVGGEEAARQLQRQDKARHDGGEGTGEDKDKSEDEDEIIGRLTRELESVLEFQDVDERVDPKPSSTDHGPPERGVEQNTAPGVVGDIKTTTISTETVTSRPSSNDVEDAVKLEPMMNGKLETPNKSAAP